jgi:hypothetical protein
MSDDRQPPPEQELDQAGVVLQKAIDYMIEQNVSELAIASALLGGAMSMLTEILPDEVVVQILQNAISSVENGEMRSPEESAPPDQA